MATPSSAPSSAATTTTTIPASTSTTASATTATRSITIYAPMKVSTTPKVQPDLKFSRSKLEPILKAISYARLRVFNKIWDSCWQRRPEFKSPRTSSAHSNIVNHFCYFHRSYMTASPLATREGFFFSPRYTPSAEIAYDRAPRKQRSSRFRVASPSATASLQTPNPLCGFQRRTIAVHFSGWMAAPPES